MSKRPQSSLFLAFLFVICISPYAYAFDDAKALTPVGLGDVNQAPKFGLVAGFPDYNNTHINDYGIAKEIKQYPSMKLADLDDEVLFIKGTSAVGVQYVGLIRNILLHIGICYDYSNLINLPIGNSIMGRPEYDPDLLSSANAKIDYMSHNPFYVRIMATW